jgi:hypothetical protein
MPTQCAYATSPTVFVPASKLGGVFVVLPVPLADAATASGRFDASGYNTLSFFVTIADMVALNTFKAVLSVVDPETGLALASNKGDVTLVSQTASASYATSLYLPSYYATLTGLVLPFGVMLLTLSNTGGHAGTMHVTALKMWLSNA